MQKRTLLVSAALIGALTLSGSAGAVAGGLVTSAKIKDGTVRTADVKDGTLKSIDVKDGTISKADFNHAVKAKLAKAGIQGLDGESAYAIWLAAGNTERKGIAGPAGGGHALLRTGCARECQRAERPGQGDAVEVAAAPRLQGHRTIVGRTPTATLHPPAATAASS